jgi:hypothetical protein
MTSIIYATAVKRAQRARQKSENHIKNCTETCKEHLASKGARDKTRKLLEQERAKKKALQ